jgi:hypothetical protein
MPMSRGLAHLVGALCGIVLVATSMLDFYRWLPIYNSWAATMIGAVLALLGSIYASRKGSRWWYVLTSLSVAVLLLGIIALGG